KLAGNPPTSLRISDTLFLFWTREPTALDWMNLFEQADPADVEHFVRSVEAGQEDHALMDANRFYLLGLSGNSARAIVRSYLEEQLPRVMNNVALWWQQLRIADITRDGAGKPTTRFPLWQLAGATALAMDQVAPDTSARLLMAALTGGPLP